MKNCTRWLLVNNAGPDTFVRIPKEGVGTLIGPEGKTKQVNRKETKCKTSKLKQKEASPSRFWKTPRTHILLLKAKDVVTAIRQRFRS